MAGLCRVTVLGPVGFRWWGQEGDGGDKGGTQVARLGQGWRCKDGVGTLVGGWDTCGEVRKVMIVSSGRDP